MHKFVQGDVDLLVTTTVVEVGVNVPNATVMLVEGAERFGLAQLHQLRGRVARGNREAYCFLFGEINTGSSKYRLKIFCNTTDGFKIAEEDLRLRGPGELLGTRQHGLPELKLASLVEDAVLVDLARKEALAILRQDVKLKRAEHQGLAREVKRCFNNLAI